MEEREETIEELKHQVFHNKKMEEERKISDAKYADKIVEKIIFGMITFILLSVLASIIALVVRSIG